MWYDPVTESSAFGQSAAGTVWYRDDAKRFYANHWPTKQMKFFDKSSSIYMFPTCTATPPVQVPCTGCPSATGQGGSSTG